MSYKNILKVLFAVTIVTFLTVSSIFAQNEFLKDASGTVWVTNRTFGNVAAFDAATGNVLATIPVGANPIGVVSPPNTNKVYVSNEDSNSVSVISKARLSVVATIQLSVGSKPHHINYSPDGRFVYVAEFGSNKVGVIDTETDALVAEFVTNRLPTARPHAVWISEDNKTIYVANAGANEIAALDTASGEILWSLPVGENPSEILVTHNKERAYVSVRKIAYVSVRNENKVKVIDLETRSIVDEIVVGTQPDTLRLTPNGKTLVVTLRGTPAQISIVNVFETLSAQLVNIAPNTTTGHHWLSQNGRYSFVAVETPGSLAVVDNLTAQVVATYAYPGGGRPHGVFYEPTKLQTNVE